ncbi:MULTISPECIES: sugar transferase [Listeria]|uniref:sugar transferase n=1 Tax=Listeria TaxID=1637 RepID=UPI000B59763B|nr:MULTISPECIES: sugar transferase [Listeria]
MEQSKLSMAFQATDKTNYTKWKIRCDRFLSVFALLLLSPLFLFVAICIKVTDWKAPVIFKQERVGKNGKVFYMYKFRTMCTDAESQLSTILKLNDVTGAMFKMKNDPRITKIGRLLRKTSLDELPQIWNVVKGDMSLVGPRPPLPREVAVYSTYDKQRLLVTPGCTGLWQVSGRNELSFEEMVELDLHYIRHLSWKMDFKIFFKTFVVLLVPKGAY